MLFGDEICGTARLFCFSQTIGRLASSCELNVLVASVCQLHNFSACPSLSYTFPGSLGKPPGQIPVP